MCKQNANKHGSLCEFPPPPDEDGIILANGKHLQENINGASCRKLMDVNNKINFIQLCTSSDIDVDPRRVTALSLSERKAT
jgi:hypothetical protein